MMIREDDKEEAEIIQKDIVLTTTDDELVFIPFFGEKRTDDCPDCWDEISK